MARKATPKTTTTSTPRPVTLNAMMRESLISSIVADIPRPDHTELSSKVEKDMLSKLPQAVRVMMNNPEHRDYIQTAHHIVFLAYDVPGSRYEHTHTLVRAPIPSRSSHQSRAQLRTTGNNKLLPLADQLDDTPEWFAQDPELVQQCVDAAEEFLAYRRAVDAIETAVKACKTSKHLRERHPHFNSYTDAMLAEYKPEVNSNLPDDNLALTLESLGWPDKAKNPVTESAEGIGG